MQGVETTVVTSLKSRPDLELTSSQTPPLSTGVERVSVSENLIISPEARGTLGGVTVASQVPEPVLLQLEAERCAKDVHSNAGVNAAGDPVDGGALGGDGALELSPVAHFVQGVKTTASASPGSCPQLASSHPLPSSWGVEQASASKSPVPSPEAVGALRLSGVAVTPQVLEPALLQVVVCSKGAQDSTDVNVDATTTTSLESCQQLALTATHSVPSSAGVEVSASENLTLIPEAVGTLAGVPVASQVVDPVLSQVVDGARRMENIAGTDSTVASWFRHDYAGLRAMGDTFKRHNLQNGPTPNARASWDKLVDVWVVHEKQFGFRTGQVL